jgi:hypothetical protein
MEPSQNEIARQIFCDALDRIQKKYIELGHQFGWVFLHTASRTLSRDTRLFFIALNPRSKQRKPAPEKSHETGNAYRVENWSDNRPSPLQRQVCAFYKLLALRLARDWQNLMDSSLAGNFCPFGSPSWHELHARNESIEFSIDLWTAILRHCAPSAIVCLGDVCYQSMSAVAGASGYHVVKNAKPYDTGWGKITYVVAEMAGPNPLLLVRLPHLSHYQIFGRVRATDEFQPLFAKLYEYLS